MGIAPLRRATLTTDRPRCSNMATFCNRMTIGAEEGQRAERRERVGKMTSRIYGAEVREYKPYVKDGAVGVAFARRLFANDQPAKRCRHFSQKMSALHIGAHYPCRKWHQ